MGIITLTTDFGGDFYVGQMKGVILKLNKDANIVDISHEVERQNIFQGAFLISQIWRYFPQGSIHIGVVDPGVGSERKGIIVKTNYCYFVGPDNGLFSLALKDHKVEKIIEIDQQKVREITGNEISKTFHGRDVFAPMAALICKGESMEKFGREIERWIKLKWEKNKIIHIDHFGNVITSLPCRIVENFEWGQKIKLKCGEKEIKAKKVKTFSEGERGKFLLLEGSHGFLELDMRGGNAAEELNVKIGDGIKILG